MNRKAVKSFYTLSFSPVNSPYYKFEKLVKLVVPCGRDDLKNFLVRTGRNAMYTSHIAVVEFIEALGMWIVESILKRLCQTSCFSIMADERTDVIIKEMSVFRQSEEGGSPEEHFWR